MDKTLAECLDSFTENNLQGNGYFDRIMGSIELHIHDEFDKNRITGANYAQSYIAAIQAALQSSTQLLVQAPDLELKRLQLEEAKVKLEAAKVQLEIAGLEKEKLKWEIEKLKVDLDIAKVQLEIEKAKLELLPFQKELLRWQAVSEQANTCDIVNNEESCYGGAITNIHGLYGSKLKAENTQIDLSEKAAYLNVAEKLVTHPFSVIESAEGVGASYFGLNGSNGIEILNKVRKAYGMTPLDTTTHAGEHAEYMNTYAPDATVENSGDS